MRKLLGYLTLHGAVSRERLAEDLWPDLAWEAQSRNLRVTLTYLLRVLEPQRAPRDPSYFMRTQGSILSLHAGEHLSVDVWEFDALGNEAVRADGERRPSEVLEISLRAVELWRGEPTELLSEPWAVLQLEQRRLRFAAVATRAVSCSSRRGTASRPTRSPVARSRSTRGWKERTGSSWPRIGRPATSEPPATRSPGTAS